MKSPPRVPGLPILGNSLEYLKDPLAFVRRVPRDYGDIAEIRIGNITAYLLSDPDLIEQVLVTDNKSYWKDRFARDLKRILGNGLLTSEGDFWRRQRRLSQPAFHKERIAAYGETMVELTQRTLQEFSSGSSRDIHKDMMQLTLAIVSKTLFGADTSDRNVARVVGQALEEVLDHFLDPVRSFLPIVDRLPIPSNRRFDEAVRTLDKVVYDMIAAQRRRKDSNGADLLSMLMGARDEDGSRMDDRQLRDEVMTLFLAGHETTAIAMSWTFYLLSENPHVDEALAEELARVLAGRTPTVADLPKLPYATQVITESMRMFPPAWSLGREAIVDTKVGDYDVPKGMQVWMVQWAMHRDARWFDEPDRFMPERWAGDLHKRLPKYAYFPFGGGPRLCIGNAFAMMEATLLLATIAQRFRLTLVPGHRVQTAPGVTLRPKYGMQMRVEART